MRITDLKGQGFLYLLSMSLAGAVALSGETLRGWEAVAFVVLCPLASLALGFAVGDTRALTLSVIAFLIIALPLPVTLRWLGVHQSDAQDGLLAPVMTALSCACVLIGWFFRARWWTSRNAG